VQGVLNGFADQHRAVIYAMESGRNCAAPTMPATSITLLSAFTNLRRSRAAAHLYKMRLGRTPILGEQGE